MPPFKFLNWKGPVIRDHVNARFTWTAYIYASLFLSFFNMYIVFKFNGHKYINCVQIRLKLGTLWQEVFKNNISLSLSALKPPNETIYIFRPIAVPNCVCVYIMHFEHWMSKRMSILSLSTLSSISEFKDI